MSDYTGTNVRFGDSRNDRTNQKIGDYKSTELRLMIPTTLYQRLEKFTGGNRIQRHNLYSAILNAAADALDGKGDDQRPIGEVIAEKILRKIDQMG